MGAGNAHHQKRHRADDAGEETGQRVQRMQPAHIVAHGLVKHQLLTPSSRRRGEHRAAAEAVHRQAGDDAATLSATMARLLANSASTGGTPNCFCKRWASSESPPRW